MEIQHRFNRKALVAAAVGGLLVGAIGAVATAPQAHAVEGVISIAAASITEGNSGVRLLSVGVASSDARTVNCEVNWTLTDVSADNGTDYSPQGGGQRLGLGAGPAFSILDIAVLRVNGDTTVEGDETVRMTLVNDGDAELDCVVGGTTSVLLTIENDDSAVVSTISVADTSFVEGDGNSHLESVVVVSSPNPVQLSCEVIFEVVDGSATSGSDYSLGGGGVMGAGETSKSIVATRIFGDTDFEGNETFTLRLINDADANLDCPIGDSEATITIVDDDTALPVRRMTVGDVTVTEGDSGTTSATFDLQLDGPANGDETVVFNTVNGTATAGSDYTAIVNQTVTFVAGESTHPVTVDIIGDTDTESTETFTLVPSNQNNVLFGVDHEGIGRITNDDGNAVNAATINGFSVAEGDSGVQSVGLSVVLNGPANGNETFTISTSNGSATSGSDYTALTQSVAFAANQTARTVFLDVLGDTTLEPDETINVAVTNIQNFAMTATSAVVTITNDDTVAVAPSVVSLPTTQTVTEAGPKYAVTTTMTNPTGRTCRVIYDTANGSAGTGDYSSLIGEVNTHVSQATATQTFEILEDLLAEDVETFTVTMRLDTALSDPSCELGNSTMTVTISDNDTPPPALRSLSIGNATRAEGNSGISQMAFTIGLDGAATGNETVRVSTQSGTASSISDYAAVTDQLVAFTAGQTTQILNVTINGDAAVELDETFSVIVGSPVNVSIADGTGQGIITNDDSPPPPSSGPVLISVNDTSAIEGNSGKTPMVFTVTLNRASTETIKVKVETNDSQAARSSDYVFLEQRLTFAPGETEKLVTVQIRGDKKHERDERFTLVLDSPKNAKIDKDHRKGKGIILNDDPDDDDD